MPIKITPRVNEANPDISIYNIAGRITRREGDEAIDDLVAREMRINTAPKLLLDLAEATAIDDSGIAALVAANLIVDNAGGEFKLLSVAGSVKNRLFSEGILDLLDTYDSEEEAIRSFGPLRSAIAQTSARKFTP